MNAESSLAFQTNTEKIGRGAFLHVSKVSGVGVLDAHLPGERRATIMSTCSVQRVGSARDVRGCLNSSANTLWLESNASEHRSRQEG